MADQSRGSPEAAALTRAEREDRLGVRGRELLGLMYQSHLPAEKRSHGLRELAAIESVRGSFQDAAAATTRATG